METTVLENTMSEAADYKTTPEWLAYETACTARKASEAAYNELADLVYELGKEERMFELKKAGLACDKAITAEMKAFNAYNDAVAARTGYLREKEAEPELVTGNFSTGSFTNRLADAAVIALTLTSLKETLLTQCLQAAA